MAFTLTLSTGTIFINSNDHKLSAERYSCEQRILTLYKENHLYLPVRLYTLTDDDLLILAQGIIDHLKREKKRKSTITKITSVLDSLSDTHSLFDSQIFQDYQRRQSPQETEIPRLHKNKSPIIEKPSSSLNTKPSLPDVPESDSFSEFGKRTLLFSRPKPLGNTRKLVLDFNRFTEVGPELTPFIHIGHVTIPGGTDLYVLDEEAEAGIGSLTSSATFGEYGSKSNYIANTTVTSRVPSMEDPDIYPYGYCYAHLAHPMCRGQYNNSNLFLDRKILDQMKKEPLFDGLLYLHLFKNRLHISHLPVLDDTISCPIKAASFIERIDPLIKQGSYPSFNELFDLFKEIHNSLMKNTVQVYRTVTM